jgi:hypothetical protein
MTTMFEKKRTDYAKGLLFSLIHSFLQHHDFEQASVMSAKNFISNTKVNCNHIDLTLSEYILINSLPFDPLISLLICHWNQKQQQQ